MTAMTDCFSTESVELFITDPLRPTLAVLGQRQCMPDDFHQSSKPKAQACKARVQAGDVPPECDGDEILTQYYNCYANR